MLAAARAFVESRVERYDVTMNFVQSEGVWECTPVLIPSLPSMAGQYREEEGARCT